jgi:hypothetical protein
MALGIRIPILSEGYDMWHDAGFTYLYSQKPLTFILDSNDVHPPLYYLYMKAWLKVSHDELWIRLSSLILLIPFLYYFYGLMREKLERTTSIVSILVVSLSPTLIYYSLEPRNYMLGMLLAVMQVTYFYKEPSRKNLIILTLISIAMLYTHYFTAYLLLAELIIIFLHSKPWKPYKPYAAIICASVVPLAIYTIRVLLKSEAFWFKDITPLSLISTIAYQYTLPKLMGEYSLMFYVGFFIIVIAAMIYLLVLTDYDAFLFFFMPIGIVWGISQLHPMYHHRFFLFYSFALYWLVAPVIAYAWKKNWLGTMLFLTATIMIPTSYAYIHFADNQSHELSRSASVVRDYLQIEPLPIVHETTFSQTPYKYYLRDLNVTNYLRTNLTEKQRFTAGGSVIEPGELNPDIDQYLLISSKILPYQVIYQGGGLHVYKVE